MVFMINLIYKTSLYVSNVLKKDDDIINAYYKQRHC